VFDQVVGILGVFSRVGTQRILLMRRGHEAPTQRHGDGEHDPDQHGAFGLVHALSSTLGAIPLHHLTKSPPLRGPRSGRP